MSEPARVLVVCTGNVCRSPLTERLLRLRLAQRLGEGSSRVRVASAGVRALVGSGMTAAAAEELRALGGDDAGFVSRQLTGDLVDDADLVVAAATEHRSAVVSLSAVAARRTFTLRELDRLLQDIDLTDLPTDPADRLRAVVVAAHSRRGSVPAGGGRDDDVADPYGRSAAVYAATTRQIAPAVERLVGAIAG
jgi:protein-tyrosine phosphatase